MPVKNEFRVARPHTDLFQEILTCVQGWREELQDYDGWDEPGNIEEVVDVSLALGDVCNAVVQANDTPIRAVWLAEAAIKADALYELELGEISADTTTPEISEAWTRDFFFPALTDENILINPRILLSCVIAADEGWHITNGTRRHWVGDWLKDLLLDAGVVFEARRQS